MNHIRPLTRGTVQKGVGPEIMIPWLCQGIFSLADAVPFALILAFTKIVCGKAELSLLDLLVEILYDFIVKRNGPRRFIS